LQHPEQLLLEQAKESLQTPPAQVSHNPHDLQARPAVPQAATSVPGLHTSPSQHPAGQVLQSHPVAHVPPMHLVPPAHCWHWAPLSPQVASRCPGLQKSPWQQPVQFLLVQVHFPLTHSWLDPQAVQAVPPPPQAAWVLPGTQVSWLSQQPEVQLVALHWVDVASHLPALQASLFLQAWQAWPPVPQAASLFPGAQPP